MLTALPVEYSAVRAHVGELREEVHPAGTIYESGRFGEGAGGWSVSVAEIGPLGISYSQVPGGLYVPRGADIHSSAAANLSIRLGLVRRPGAGGAGFGRFAGVKLFVSRADNRSDAGPSQHALVAHPDRPNNGTAMPLTSGKLDLERLLMLRLVVACFGEMDRTKSWNTSGPFGHLGAAALRRGFPRTHRFPPSACGVRRGRPTLREARRSAGSAEVPSVRAEGTHPPEEASSVERR